jgi:predicted membrane channel-forming protein YqfA (hemolysin III family)
MLKTPQKRTAFLIALFVTAVLVGFLAHDHFGIVFNSADDPIFSKIKLLVFFPLVLMLLLSIVPAESITSPITMMITVGLMFLSYILYFIGVFLGVYFCSLLAITAIKEVTKNKQVVGKRSRKK